jgi:transposase
VDNNSSDIRSLIPSLEKLQRKYNKLPKILLADKGYPSEENFEYLKSNNVN